MIRMIFSLVGMIVRCLAALDTGNKGSFSSLLVLVLCLLFGLYLFWAISP
jgi:hypothetical protein